MLPHTLREYPAIARPHVLSKRSFVVKLVPKRLTDWRQFGKKERWDLVQRVIAPNVSDAVECYLYTNGAGADEALPASSFAMLQRDGKRFKVSPDSESFSDIHREFWIDWSWNRGPVAWLQLHNAGIAKSTFAHCFDPIAMENPAVYLGQNVIALAKRRTVKTDNVCFVLPSGVEQLFVFANTEIIGSLFDLALEHCSFTEDFQSCYGVG